MSHTTRHASPKRMYVEPQLRTLVADPVDCPNCGETECDCSEEDKEIAALADCTGTPSKRTGRNERCAWTRKSDWLGDPSIPRGTMSWTYAECLACGAEVQAPYPEWLQRTFDSQEDMS